ncbi:DgyrCDS7037 [Dimorphilus gyrociliatus]|uniref:Phosphomannomutase n=1 Tax=Dimorphilus gyrociliatus TaxID=2664684 RepID=A0A7I8VPZ7_9ANNE|nr:DgyrCDS7037 [Dimorphilus gyrociliatus]
MARNKSRVLLFDVDNTLTPSRNKIEPHMEQLMLELREKFLLGVVSGSDLHKIAYQMTSCPNKNSFDELFKRYNYVFLENGLVAYRQAELISKKCIREFLGETKVQEFINLALSELAKITLPVKRGHFIECRTGLINVSPIGRSCSQAEREAFVEYDREYKIREKLMTKFGENYPDGELSFAIGGQISIDVFPTGWDKTICLQHLVDDGIEEIHFFGDRIYPGGNDWGIYHDPRTIGHIVKNPDDTMRQLLELLEILD